MSISANVSDWFTQAQAASKSAKKTAHLRVNFSNAVEKAYKELYSGSTGDRVFDKIGEDLVAIGAEVRHARLIGDNDNYIHSLELLQDAIRFFVHKSNGRMAGLKTFLGVRTQEEKELATVARLSKVVRQSNADLFDAIRGLIPEIAHQSAESTVRALRETPQKRQDQKSTAS